MTPLHRLTRGFHGRRPFRDARDGAAMIEFTLALPIMIMLFAGVVEFSEAFAVNRKLTNAAAAVSDLVAQQAQVSKADLDDIAMIADTLLSPYSAASLGLVITSVEADRNGATAVGWSYAKGSGATARAAGGAWSPPAGLTEPNSSIILTEASYQFTPTIAFYLTGSITLNGRAYFRPRATRAVSKIN